ncbi:hypothetical protein DUNSADRAFT_7756 [Dunaliella salina]|uniref:Secreted protein n=1 Tax=Dunaliella salina TaxID=3046 RepID=A0ABQ7GKS6_DUNSA|nr:hypothetical protein DUNSADRAFT_7756 [Dunaliella salina]|eukprot:KAF5835214.1 hypothetical protein DUNSADRAFT_7756 [Dunaliella salina]
MCGAGHIIVCWLQLFSPLVRLHMFPEVLCGLLQGSEDFSERATVQVRPVIQSTMSVGLMYPLAIGTIHAARLRVARSSAPSNVVHFLCLVLEENKFFSILDGVTYKC